MRSGILGGGDEVGWLAGRPKGKPREMAWEKKWWSRQKARAPAHARTYQGSIHHRRSIRLVSPTAVERLSRKEENGRGSDFSSS